MFSRVFLICALALAASAYQIGNSYYQGAQIPEERYGGYQYYLRLIGAGSPYYQGYYKQSYPYGYSGRYYTPVVDQENIYVEPQEQQQVYYQRSYPQYISNLFRYPYFARYFQQYYNQPGYVYPLNYERQYQYQQQQEQFPYYGYEQQYYNRVPYQQEYGQQYGRGYYYNQYQQQPQQQGRYYSSLLNRILGYQQYQPEYVY